MAQELKAFKLGSVELGEYWAYDAEEVDAVLAEKDAEIDRLKAENIRLRKRLLRMCARLGKMGYLAFLNIKTKLTMFGDDEGVDMASTYMNRWRNVERKCRAKAEEYK